MFQLGELFVAMTARDAGLSRTIDNVGKRARDARGRFVATGVAGRVMGRTLSTSFRGVAIAAQTAWAAATMGISILIALGAAAGMAAGGGAAGLIGLASSAGEVNSKFNVVFGENAPRATKELERLADGVGRSRNEMKKLASGVQDLLVPMGFARDKATDMSVKVSRLAVDLASFNNVSDADAMNDITSALTGSGEVMKKYGVILNETTLKAELQRMGIEGGTAAASEQAKSLARLNIIVRGTTDAHGDAARTGGSFQNQMKRMGGILKDIGVQLGNILLPAAEVFMQFLGDQASALREGTSGLESWGDALKTAAEFVVMWLQRGITLITNWDLATEAGQLATTTFVETAGASFRWLWENAVALAEWFGNALMTLFPEILNGIASEHGNLWRFLQRGWDEIWDFIASGGRDSIELGLDKIISKAAAKIDAPSFSGFETPAVFEEWDGLLDKIDRRTKSMRKDTSEFAGEIDAFDKSLAGGMLGSSGKEKKIKFELVSASSLFSKNLKEAFDREGKERTEILKRTAMAGEETAAASKKLPPKIDRLSDVIGKAITRPIVTD